MKQKYAVIVLFALIVASSFTSLDSYRSASRLVSEGQAVSRGQLLAEMDDTRARNLLNGAEAQLTQANDALERCPRR